MLFGIMKGEIPSKTSFVATEYYSVTTKAMITGGIMLNENDVAPDFELLNDEGAPTKLSDFRGKRIVLYFYPKAMTGG